MIIRSLDELKSVVAFLATGVDWTDLQAYVNLADQLLKDEILGSELYDDIMANIDAAGYADTVALCRQVIGHRAFSEGIPFLDLVLTPTGFAVTSNNNLAPASKERVKKLRDQAFNLSDRFTEAFLDHLEATVAYHAKWKISAAYLTYSDSLIKTGKELSRYAAKQYTRSDFLYIRADILNFTATHLHPYLSKALIDELITQQNAGTLTDPNKLIVPKIKQALGCLLVKRVKDAEILMGDVLGIIDTDLESYPTYTASEEYAGRIEVGYVNEAETGIFVFGA